MSAPWRVRGAQLLTVIALESGRRLRDRQTAALFVLALMPLAPALVGFFPRSHRVPLQETPLVFAQFYEASFLTIMVFFSCASLFSDLFRRDMAEKSLHYWLLAPVRREVLALGKYLSAVLLVGGIYAVSTAAAYGAWLAPHGLRVAGREILAARAAVGAYVLVTVLAVACYGGLFLLLGLLFKSPIIPGLGIWLWEGVNHMLPSVLKGFSIIHYLKGLLPIRLDEGLFALSAAPPSPSVSITGLLAFTVACLVASARWVRRIEISYGTD